MKNSTLQNLRIIITAFFLIVPFILPAQTITVSGEITADTTWAADTVKVTGDILIRDSIKLTIAPGTYIEFQGFYEIEVFGTLVAAGTPSNARGAMLRQEKIILP